MKKKLLSSDEFVGKSVNIDGENLELENVILVSIEENGILVYDDMEDVNYYIPKAKLNSMNDNIDEDDE